MVGGCAARFPLVGGVVRPVPELYLAPCRPGSSYRCTGVDHWWQLGGTSHARRTSCGRLAFGRTREIIEQVRARFNGQIWWALPFSQAVVGAPPFLDSVDGIYLLFSEPLTSRPDATQDELEAEAARLVDTALLPLRLRFDKPLFLAPAYASADGAGTACLPDPAGGCLPLSALEQPAPDFPAIPLDLQEQVDIYSALLSVVNTRTWIDGFISRGYYPPAALQDKSASVHGKPALDILAYYYPRLTGAMP
jgi:hypothetical protein